MIVTKTVSVLQPNKRLQIKNKYLIFMKLLFEVRKNKHGKYYYFISLLIYLSSFDILLTYQNKAYKGEAKIFSIIECCFCKFCHIQNY